MVSSRVLTLVVLVGSVTLSGCIGAGSQGFDPEEVEVRPAFDDFVICQADEVTGYDDDCIADAAPAIVLAELPSGALCFGDYGTHKVYADADGDVLLELQLLNDDKDHVTGAYYQPGRRVVYWQGMVSHSIPTYRFQWTAAGSSNIVALDMPMDDFLGVESHTLRFASLDVDAEGRAQTGAFAVEWLLLDEDIFEPIYRFVTTVDDGIYGGNRYFRGPAPIDIEGSDFALSIDHYDNIPAGSGATNRATGC